MSENMEPSPYEKVQLRQAERAAQTQRGSRLSRKLLRLFEERQRAERPVDRKLTQKALDTALQVLDCLTTSGNDMAVYLAIEEVVDEYTRSKNVFGPDPDLAFVVWAAERAEALDVRLSGLGLTLP